MATAQQPAKADPQLQKLLIALQDAKGEQAAWTDEVERLQALVLAKLEAVKSATFIDTDGDTYQATRVAGEGVVTDMVALRKKLNAAQWALITTPQVDKKKLEAAIVTGQVSGEVVAAASQTRDNKPYIRFTKKGGRRKK